MDKYQLRRVLAQDFRNLMKQSPLSRGRIDAIFQWFRSATVTQLADECSALSKCLASDPGILEKYQTPVGEVEFREPQYLAVYRQLVGFFSRLQDNVAPETVDLQLHEAAQRLAEKPTIDLSLREYDHCRYFIRRCIGTRPPDIRSWPFRHGPGAVATGEKGLEKTHFTASFIAADEYAGFNTDDLLRLPNAPFRCLDRCIPVTRVIPVPKTATKIRVISCEPLTMQFFQQGLKGVMYSRMSHNPHFPLFDQSYSIRLASLGSRCESWGRRWQPCTVDLSNASDDVRCRHVELLFPAEWARALLAFRSEFARFPFGEVELTTFAPMGAATSFPVETLVFAALRYAAYRETRERGDVDEWAQYGDDSITAAYSYAYFLDLLARAGFHPNVSKCCGPTVRFRESCGGDFLEGEDVTYVRPRIIKLGTFAAIPPTVEMVRGLLHRGFRITAQALADTVTGPVPLGFWADSRCTLSWRHPGRIRFNQNLQRWEQEGVVNEAIPSTPLGAVDGWEGLYTAFTSGWRSETSFPTRTRAKRKFLPCFAYPYVK